MHSPSSKKSPDSFRSQKHFTRYIQKKPPQQSCRLDPFLFTLRPTVRYEYFQSSKASTGQHYSSSINSAWLGGRASSVASRAVGIDGRIFFTIVDATEQKQTTPLRFIALARRLPYFHQRRHHFHKQKDLQENCCISSQERRA